MQDKTLIRDKLLPVIYHPELYEMYSLWQWYSPSLANFSRSFPKYSLYHRLIVLGICNLAASMSDRNHYWEWNMSLTVILIKEWPAQNHDKQIDDSLGKHSTAMWNTTMTSSPEFQSSHLQSIELPSLAHAHNCSHMDTMFRFHLPCFEFFAHWKTFLGIQ